MKLYELRKFSTDVELATAAARDFVSRVTAAKGKPFGVALSGGRIAKGFLGSVCAEGRGSKDLLASVDYFWGDERCVPPGDPESNFRLAEEHLFKPLNIPNGRIHRIEGEKAPAVAAELASSELRQTLSKLHEASPILDLALLGMGEDGHIASLFPGSSARGDGVIYYPIVATKPPPNRITISFEVLAAAREVWVLASGSGKGAALQKSLEEPDSTPLSKLLQMRASTLIYTDIRLESSTAK